MKFASLVSRSRAKTGTDFSSLGAQFLLAGERKASPAVRGIDANTKGGQSAPSQFCIIQASANTFLQLGRFNTRDTILSLCIPESAPASDISVRVLSPTARSSTIPLTCVEASSITQLKTITRRHSCPSIRSIKLLRLVNPGRQLLSRTYPSSEESSATYCRRGSAVCGMITGLILLENT